MVKCIGQYEENIPDTVVAVNNVLDYLGIFLSKYFKQNNRLLLGTSMCQLLQPDCVEIPELQGTIWGVDEVRSTTRPFPPERPWCNT